MSIKSVLCPYAGEHNRASALDRAIRIARRHDAWLTGVVSRGPAMLERRFRNVLTQQMLTKLRQDEESLVREIEGVFTQHVTEAGIADRSEFQTFSDNDDQKLSVFARGFDFIVIGPHSEELSDEHLSPRPDVLAMMSGRPVMVVPNDYRTESPAKNVLVAWDGKRSAARAVSEAINLLEDSPKITLLTVGDQAETTIGGAGGIRTLLQRHGFETHHLHHKRDIHRIGNHILAAAEEIGADLIVMGAYEHSKFSHDWFGGPTTDVVGASKIPVLLAH